MNENPPESRSTSPAQASGPHRAARRGHLCGAAATVLRAGNGASRWLSLAGAAAAWLLFAVTPARAASAPDAGTAAPAHAANAPADPGTSADTREGNLSIGARAWVAPGIGPSGVGGVPVAAGLAAAYSPRPYFALGAEFELIREGSRGDYFYYCHTAARSGCLSESKAVFGFGEVRTTWHSPFNLFGRASFGLGWAERSAVGGYESHLEGIVRASAGGELRASAVYVRPYAIAITFGGREPNVGYGFELGAAF